MPKTFPSDSQSGADSDAITAKLLPPQLSRKAYGIASFPGQSNSNRYEGFLGNGDYVELPILPGNNIEYFNAAGSSQWTVALTDIDASLEDFVGFTLDKAQRLIYVIGVDEGTTPNTYYTASINSAGTVVNIGNDQPTGDFTTTATDWWKFPAATVGSSLIQRERDGFGNLFARQTNSGGMEEMEVDISDGSIVSDPAVINAALTNCCWRSKSGVYYSVAVAATQQFYSESTGLYTVNIIDSPNFGWVNNPVLKNTQWKGRSVTTEPDSAASVVNRFSNTITNYDAWIDAVVAAYGVE